MQPDPAVAAEYRAAGWWGDTTVGDAVASWARERPAGDAIVADGRRATWSDYDERATALARVLVGTGLPRGARVAVLLPDGVAVHVAFVAAERAGLTVVGLGHRAGDDEIRHLVGLTRAAALITLDQHRGRPDRGPGRRAPQCGVPARTPRGGRRRGAPGRSPGGRGRRRRARLRARRPLPDQLDVRHHRHAEVRDAHPEPVDVLPPARRRSRRHDRPTTSSSARSRPRSASASGRRT